MKPSQDGFSEVLSGRFPAFGLGETDKDNILIANRLKQCGVGTKWTDEGSISGNQYSIAVYNRAAPPLGGDSHYRSDDRGLAVATPVRRSRTGARAAGSARPEFARAHGGSRRIVARSFGRNRNLFTHDRVQLHHPALDDADPEPLATRLDVLALGGMV